MVAAGFVARTFAAIAFSKLERSDEIFQNLEPAYRLLTGYGVVTWEWQDGIRSWLFPAFLSSIMSVPRLLGLPADMSLPLVWASLALVSC
ncbi:MAG: hypothetical protein RQ966_08360, partial [Acetobacteraceae bacterium]|nr:hypothetical protein [Acetobacteraceae bacterium]